jgi:hypothetical protein
MVLGLGFWEVILKNDVIAARAIQLEIASPDKS